jgi:hypothetical protein
MVRLIAYRQNEVARRGHWGRLAGQIGSRLSPMDHAFFHVEGWKFSPGCERGYHSRVICLKVNWPPLDSFFDPLPGGEGDGPAFWLPAVSPGD